MLKRLAILAVLLAIAQAPMRMPGQATETAARGSGKPDGKGQSANSQSTPSVPLEKPQNSASADKGTGQPTADDKEHSVKLTSLPPVKVISEEKTFWNHVLDWGPWVFNSGLVAVGILQIVLLKWNWKTIKRQADIMEIQAKDTRESGAEATKIALATAQAAQKSADAASAQIQMMKDKERARLALILQPLNEIEMGDGPGDIELRIGNFGSTHAFNVRYGAWCEITHSKEEPFDPYPESAVGIIRANADPERIREGIMTNISGPQIKANVRDLLVHLAGRIEYEDVFGDSHFIRFQYIRRIPRLSDPIERDGIIVFPIVGLSGWKKCPHPDHNKEG